MSSSFLKYLLDNNVIGIDVYDIAINSGYINCENLDEFLMSAVGISEDDIAAHRAAYYGIAYVNDDDLFAAAQSYQDVPLNNVVAAPYRVDKDELCVAIHNPEDLLLIDQIKRSCHEYESINFVVAKKSSILATIKKQSNKSYSDVSDAGLVDAIALEAIENGASDIHISPCENTFEVKHRIDGSLRPIKIFPIEKFQALCVSIKVMAKLDISEARRPQSGHFQYDNNTDFRISTQPTIYGENISIRILSKNRAHISIENIGFSDEQVNQLKRIAQLSHGMIIFCGPTGSGKTTSIYSILATIDKVSKNVMTLEDPVEYRIYGVKQTEIRNGVIDFAGGVRAMLRQDPDVIFIGEIRDSETAQIAIRASMTGHLVFTTLHANDSVSAIKRFQDLNISPFLVADNIISIISQRLVKSTSKGRTIISEILHIDSVINDMICNNASKNKIAGYAKKNCGFKTLAEDCEEKIKNGIVSHDVIVH